MFWNKKKEESVDESVDEVHEEFSTLESTLQGIFWSNGLKTSILNSKEEKVSCLVYTLPIEMRLDRVFVDIILNEKNIEKSIEFYKKSIQNLLEGNVDINDLIITKSIRAVANSLLVNSGL